MSYYHTSQCDRDQMKLLRSGKDPALIHAGTPASQLEFIKDHEAAIARGEDLPPLKDFAFNRVANATILMAGLNILRQSGSRSPGPDGQCLEDISRSAGGEMCRRLSSEIKAGTYSLRPSRTVKIPKSGGTRKIYVQNVDDRVVAKTATIILTPIFNSSFDATSFGFRPGQDTAAALATAFARSMADERFVWASADVKNAFEAVPLNRLQVAVKSRRLPENLEQLIMVFAGGNKGRGLRQGSPLAPLLFNLFMDHFLDKRWSQEMPDIPLIRYADDLLLLCKTPDEAASAMEKLTCMLIDIGTPLKKSEGLPYAILDTARHVQFLGYQVTKANGKLVSVIAPKAWESLGLKLAECHVKFDATFRAADVITGWISYMGPCYGNTQHDAVLEKIRALAIEQGFLEMPSEVKLMEVWKKAYDSWAEKIAAVEKAIAEVADIANVANDFVDSNVAECTELNDTCEFVTDFEPF